MIFSVNTCNKFRESILRHKIELEDRAAAPTVTVTRSIVIFPKPTAGGGGRPCEQTVNDLGAHAAQEDVPHPVRSDDAVAYVGTPFERR